MTAVTPAPPTHRRPHRPRPASHLRHRSDGRSRLRAAAGFAF
ncbi:urea ABC transporter permease subunit UrtC, partial [Micromonospora provocatoris]